VYIQNEILFSCRGKKKREMLSFATTWMNWDIVLNEVNQTEGK
jgi:hypothetical protein